MKDNSRGQTPQEVLDAKKANVQYVSNLEEAVEDVASRTSRTSMFVTNAVQPISEKRPETYIFTRGQEHQDSFDKKKSDDQLEHLNVLHGVKETNK